MLRKYKILQDTVYAKKYYREKDLQSFFMSRKSGSEISHGVVPSIAWREIVQLFVYDSLLSPVSQNV